MEHAFVIRQKYIKFLSRCVRVPLAHFILTNSMVRQNGFCHVKAFLTPTTGYDFRAIIDELRAENAQLRGELAATRAELAEARAELAEFRAERTARATTATPAPGSAADAAAP